MILRDVLNAVEAKSTGNETDLLRQACESSRGLCVGDNCTCYVSRGTPFGVETKRHLMRGVLVCFLFLLASSSHKFPKLADLVSFFVRFDFSSGETDERHVLNQYFNYLLYV